MSRASIEKSRYAYPLREVHVPPGRLIDDDGEDNAAIREEERAYAGEPPSPKERVLFFHSQKVVPHK